MEPILNTTMHFTPPKSRLCTYISRWGQARSRRSRLSKINAAAGMHKFLEEQEIKALNCPTPSSLPPRERETFENPELPSQPLPTPQAPKVAPRMPCPESPG